MNLIDWGLVAEKLSRNKRWIRNYNDSKFSSVNLITLEIFDEIATRLKQNNAHVGKKRGVVYTPYRLAVQIAEKSLIYWISNLLPIKDGLNSLFDIGQRILELGGESKFQILKKIRSIKILDPTTGTSVFLFAVANLLSDNLNYLEPDRSIQKIKLQLLEKNLYGIDIDPFAIKISKLKFWLWINNQDNHNSYKQDNFKCNLFEGDALFGVQTLSSSIEDDIPVRRVLKYDKKSLDEQYNIKMEKKVAIYKIFSSQNSIQEINKLSHAFNEIQCIPTFKYFIFEGDRAFWNIAKKEINFSLSKKFRFSSSDVNFSKTNIFAVFAKPLEIGKIETLTSMSLECEAYSMPRKFHWVRFRLLNSSKFDLIVGNPPFIALTDLTIITRNLLRAAYPTTYTGNNDLSYFFIDRALSALKPDNGILSYILPKYLVHSFFAKKIRKKIIQSSRILEIHDLGKFSLFQGINIRIIILFLEKSKMTENYAFDFNFYQKKDEKIIRKTTKIAQSSLNPEKWILADPQKLKLLDRIRRISNIILKDVANISKGIETGCDQVFAPRGNSFFTQALTINQDHIKPWIKGKDIKRFSVIKTGREVLFAPYYRKMEIISDKKIMNYLDQNKALLFDRSRVLEYYLWRSGDERKTMEWRLPKVVTPYKAKRNTFAIDWDGSLSSKDVVWIIPKGQFSDDINFLKLIVALLNSNVLSFYSRYVVKDLGGLYEYYPKQIENFPLIIPETDTQDYHTICKVASELMKCQSHIKRKEMEEELNNIVFRLYSISREERKI
ncbi:MAG: Eco57I restriction-modification methylase domain-containing protein, partial [Candidatus Hodarchaeales archaeon]